MVSSHMVCVFSKAFSEREGIVFHFTPRLTFPTTLTTFSDAEEFVILNDGFVTAAGTELDFLFERVFEFFISFFFFLDILDGFLDNFMIGFVTPFLTFFLFLNSSNKIQYIDLSPFRNLLQGLVHFVGGNRHWYQDITNGGRRQFFIKGSTLPP